MKPGAELEKRGQPPAGPRRCPVVGRTIPARSFSSVDLPEPLAPTTPTDSPGATSKETSDRAVTAASGESARARRPRARRDLNDPDRPPPSVAPVQLRHVLDTHGHCRPASATHASSAIESRRRSKTAPPSSEARGRGRRHRRPSRPPATGRKKKALSWSAEKKAAKGLARRHGPEALRHRLGRVEDGGQEEGERQQVGDEVAHVAEVHGQRRDRERQAEDRQRPAGGARAAAARRADPGRDARPARPRRRSPPASTGSASRQVRQARARRRRRERPRAPRSSCAGAGRCGGRSRRRR